MKTKDLSPYFEFTSFRDKVVDESFSSMGESMGGMQVGAQQLSQGKIQIQGVAERILIGSATAPLTGTGIFMGSDQAATVGYDFRVGNPAGNYMHWDESAATLTIVGTITATTGTIGGFNIGTDYIRDVADSMGLASTVSGGDDVRFWAGDTYANRATADFRVTEAGAVTASSMTITGGAISGLVNSTGTDISLMECSHNLVFSVTDSNTIAWATGTVVFSNGRTFTIDAGNTGNMAALSYIYLDPAVSSTVLQVTTTYSTAMGNNKRLIGTAQNNTVTANFIPYGAGQILVDGANIGALSIVAGNIAASTITAGKMSVTQLSAIAADLGTITAGAISGITIAIGSVNSIFKADANGIYLGNATFASAPFRVSMAGAMTATSATISGAITATSGAIGGWTVNSTSIYTGTEDHSGYTTNAGDLTIYSDGTDASIHAKNFFIDSAGVLNCTAAVISGGITTTSGSSVDGQYLTAASVASASVNLAMRGWVQTSAFTVTDADTVAWGAGTFTASDGTAYSITGSNTGNMAAKTYVYLDIAVSTTAYQTTTTATTANGNGKVLVAICQNATGEAKFMVMNDNSYNIDAANIVAGSITANEIAATTITGANIATLNITGKSATFDTGTIGGFTMSATTLVATNFTVTSGAANTANVTVGTGATAGGINSPNTGTDIAFWAGSTFANRATAPFRVNAQGDVTMTSATISGVLVSTKGTFGGDGSDGALTITSGTTTVSIASAAVLVKNYSSISITSTAKLAFSNPATGGSIVFLRSQGAVTVTSTATCIDCSALGATGGAGGSGGMNNSILTGTSGTSSTKFAYGTTNGGAGGGASNGLGGAVPTFGYYTTIADILLQKYHFAFVGAGGGGGAARSGGVSNGTAGTGGRGGGALVIECGGAWNFTTASGISVAGVVGGDGVYNSGTDHEANGGGGGGGGFCLVLYATLTANSGTIVVSGGGGGLTNSANYNNNSNVWGGGGGGSNLVGSNGAEAASAGDTTGGTGGNGYSLVAQNTLY